MQIAKKKIDSGREKCRFWAGRPSFQEKGLCSPKIKEIHHAAEQFAPPALLQLEVDILGAAAEDVEFVEEVVRPPLAHHRLQAAPVDGRVFRCRFAHLCQILAHLGLAPNLARVDDVGVGRGGYGVGGVHVF